VYHEKAALTNALVALADSIDGSISVFRVDGGELSLVDYVATEGEVPRSFCVTPGRCGGARSV
jgi:6-phosphogluconolactonase (cycloisomerase 2 family)